MNSRAKLRNAILLSSVGALVLSCALYAYLYEETYRLVDDTIAARRSVHAEEAAKLQGKDIVALADRTASDRVSLEHFFSSADDPVSAIKAIESIGSAGNASVSISGISSVPPSDKQPIGTISAKVAIAGSWRDVVQAIELFEDLPRASSLDSASLRYIGQAGQKGTGDKQWAADLSVTVDTVAPRPQ